MLRPQIPDYHSTILSTYGFRIMIHSSYDYADDNAETKLVASGLEAFISISPGSKIFIHYHIILINEY